MTLELAGLSAARLLEMGGLKKQCNAGLRCVAHGLSLPCDLCDLGDATSSIGVVCNACGHHFEHGVIEPSGRICASEVEFALSGKIAFEEPVRSELVRLEEARERAVRESAAQAARDAAERDKVEARRLAAERLAAKRERERLAREAADRAARERAESQRWRELGRANDERKAARWVYAKRFVSWTAGTLGLGLFAMGALGLAWCLAAMGWFFLEHWRLALGLVVGIAVFSAALNRSNRPLAWAGALGSLYSAWVLLGLAWVGFKAWLVQPFFWAVFMGSAAVLPLATPPTKTELAKGAAVIASAVKHFRCIGPNDPANCESIKKNSGDDDAAMALRIKQYERDRKKAMAEVNAAVLSPDIIPDALSKSLPASSPEVNNPTVVAQAAVDSDAVVAIALRRIVDAVNSLDSLSGLASGGSVPELKAAEAVLATLPKPQRGDRKAARALLLEGLEVLKAGRALGGSDGSASVNAAADTLLRAHMADPLDVQVANDLAFAEVAAGRHKAAEAHILKVLTLAPTRTSAWVTFADLKSISASGAPSLIEEAVRFYIVGYWFSGDRPKMLQYLQGKAVTQSSDGGSTAMAATLAIQRIGLRDGTAAVSR